MQMRAPVSACGTASQFFHPSSVGMCVHTTRLLLQKKQTAAGYMASAGKVGGDEKWAQAAMEYIYEKKHVNDSRKRQNDVHRERSVSAAFDRYISVNERVFEERLSRLIGRMNEALEVLQEMGQNDTLDEATLLNSEQPPGCYRRPTLTPPVVGYEPGFGLDVPQLKSQQMEYPLLRRPTDTLEFGGDGENEFPFVDTHHIEDLTKTSIETLELRHGEIREAEPLTGVEGEAWEAYVALQRKALARQQLLFDLSNDSDFHDRYDNDEDFRLAEWEKRGLVPLSVEEERPREEKLHYAQVPAYEPFRMS